MVRVESGELGRRSDGHARSAREGGEGGKASDGRLLLQHAGVLDAVAGRGGERGRLDGVVPRAAQLSVGCHVMQAEPGAVGVGMHD